MVALIEARNLFQINARVIRTADEMSRSLLDVLA
jgi:flagellar basal body rod protein FlgG